LSNQQLLARGFKLVTNYLRDGTIEHWAIRGEQKLRNDPCWPLIPLECLEHHKES